MLLGSKFRMLVNGKLVGPVATLVQYEDRRMCTNPMEFVDGDYQYTPEDKKIYIMQEKVFAVLRGVGSTGKVTEFTVWNLGDDAKETMTNEMFPVYFKMIEE